mmetsp:Transcript_48193/g.108333  ORF Transcript_48193/g.108333 Transcript_48193/m.108333 type:complete len:672 (-) Transcript_48193:46-2061(-)
MGCGASTPRSTGTNSPEHERHSPPPKQLENATLAVPSKDGLLGRAISAPAPATTRQPNEVKPRSEPVARFHKEPVGRFSNDQASIAEQGRERSGEDEPVDLASTISDETRMNLFTALDKDGSGVLEPWELEPWLLSNTVNRLLFGTLDADGSNTLTADELIRGIWQLGSAKLDEESVCKLVREVDLNGDGEVALGEFLELVKTPPGPRADANPHLALNFDVNQTVLIMDSTTGSDTKAMLNEVVANAAWGRVVVPEGDMQPQWELVSSHPELKAPEVGLKTYYQYVLQDLEAKDWRSLVRQFTHPDAPGAPLSSFVAKLEAALRMPEETIEAVGHEILMDLGLDCGRWALLPSFLRCIRTLKKSGRSFTVCFRTFGTDLQRIVREWNALCENRHPFFIHEEAVFLDGSDGGQDYRLSVTPGSPSCGTWIRSDDVTALVLGSIEQPPLAEAVSVESISEFYQAAQEESVEVVPDAESARERLRGLLSVPGQGGALALRDYYPAWSHAGRKCYGGKPFFVDPKDIDVLQFFMDDHILPSDAKIVDARCSFSQYSHKMPIGAVYGSHLWRAEPLHSITDMEYFTKALATAEAQWRTACHRRRALAEAVALFAAAVATGTPLHFLRMNEVTLPHYEPWALCAEVMLASDVTILDDGEEELVELQRRLKPCKTSPH